MRGRVHQLTGEVTPPAPADCRNNGLPHPGRGVRHQLSQQLTGPPGGEPNQHAGGLGAVLARLDHAHQVIRDSQPFERRPSTAPDLGVRIVQSDQQGPDGRGADLLQRLDTPHPNPPSRIPERTDQAIDDLGPAELPQRAGDADPDERRGIGQQMFQQMIDRARGRPAGREPWLPCRVPRHRGR